MKRNGTAEWNGGLTDGKGGAFDRKWHLESHSIFI